MSRLRPEAALVILSGGQDSTTALAWAAQNFTYVHAVTFDYGQRHFVEIKAAIEVANVFGSHVSSHQVVRLKPGTLLGSSPLVDTSQDVAQYDSAEQMPEGIEPTFVPLRNMLFLTLAANRAYRLRCNSLVIGVSQEDYGGYPDCRGDFISSCEHTIQRATESYMEISAPLLHLSKKQTVEMAQVLPRAMEALSRSHTCYNGSVPPCGKCHACIMRARGFERAGIADPLLERLKKVGAL